MIELTMTSEEFQKFKAGIAANAWDAAATHAYQYGAMSLIEAPNPYRTEASHGD